MATSSAEISLKCSICLEFYFDPHVLPCLHTFCLHCLEPLVKDGTISCPQCRVKHKIPKGGVGHYPEDLSILPELEQAKGEQKICGLCTTGDIGVAYCAQCGDYLCEVCRDVVHKRGKVYVSHSVMPLNEAPTVPSSTKQLHSRCRKHIDYKLEVYCKTCSAVVCSMCMLELGHKNHQYDFIKNVGDELMKRIAKSTESLDVKEKEVKSMLHSIEKLETMIADRRAQLEQDITKSCDVYIAMIQKRKQTLLSEIENAFTQDSKRIWSAKNEFETLLLQINSCRSFSLRYQKQGHLLSLTNQLLNSLGKVEATKINVESLKNPITPCIAFTALALSSQCLGTLSNKKRSPVNGKMSLMKDIQSKDGIIFCTLGKTIYIHYTLEESFAHFFLWECASSKKQSSISCTVVRNNQVAIGYIPIEPGRHLLVLKAFGCEVCKFTLSAIESTVRL